jgi:hypothetical protein
MKRYMVITRRRTSRFTTYVIYDNEERMVLPETSTRDREKAKALAKEMNAR